MCGICAIYDPNHLAVQSLYPTLFSLQHRGQESTGIAASDLNHLKVSKGMGLITHVYTESILRELTGPIAIGHTRYSTSKGSTIEHAQPIVNQKLGFAIAHNGNLPDTTKLATFLRSKHKFNSQLNDSEMIAAAIGHYLEKGHTIEQAIIQAYPLFTGAFCLVFMTKDTLGAVRDPRGIRPLSIGRFNGHSFIIASETCAFETIKAKFLRDVKPGEMVIIDKHGLTSHQVVPGSQKLDIFEFVYFARPDSQLLGQSVNDVRFRLGVELAKECPLDADVVIPVPDSAIPAAEGYAHQSGIPMRHGFAKNRYIHRTFIQPDQRMRERGVELKLNPLPDVISGKKVIIIEDSIVRGTTASRLVKLVRTAGARKVYFLVTSPPFRYPDFYGIDAPTQKELIAATKTLQQIEQFIGADKLYYLSYEGMIAATNLPESVFNTSCFTGKYSIDIGYHQQEIHHFKQPTSLILLSTPATIINGQDIAEQKFNQLLPQIKKLSHPPLLVSVVAKQDEAGLLYTKLKQTTAQKLGIKFQKYTFDLKQKQSIYPLLDRLVAKNKFTGLIIQKPGDSVIKRFFTNKKAFEIWWLTATSKIPEKKDVDCLNVANLGLLAAGLIQFYPATVKAIYDILLTIFPKEELSGKNVAIVGSSEILGKPLALLLRNLGASVSLLGSSANLNRELLDKHIVVSGVGKPKLITASMISPQTVVIDAGISKVGKKVVGDVDFEAVAQKASYITPVPKGVGPLTVICLMENVVKAFKYASK